MAFAINAPIGLSNIVEVGRVVGSKGAVAITQGASFVDGIVQEDAMPGIIMAGCHDVCAPAVAAVKQSAEYCSWSAFPMASMSGGGGGFAPQRIRVSNVGGAVGGGGGPAGLVSCDS